MELWRRRHPEQARLRPAQPRTGSRPLARMRRGFSGQRQRLPLLGEVHVVGCAAALKGGRTPRTPPLTALK